MTFKEVVMDQALMEALDARIATRSATGHRTSDSDPSPTGLQLLR